jgi:uncharacterized membrane protein YciS (DUF1049 family)
MFWIKFLLAGAIIAVVMIVGIDFFFLNSHMVRVNYLLGNQELPLAWVLVSAFAAGAIITVLVSLVIVVPLRWRVSRLKKVVHNQDQEINTLVKRSNPQNVRWP